jgi:ATP adenylyltransferase
VSAEDPVVEKPVVEDSANFRGDPDGFGRLWTPHRMVYIKGENKPAHDEAGAGCPFCLKPGDTDEEALIVARGELVYVCLNLYPYNSGHLMTIPFRHVAGYTDLTEAETVEFGVFTQRAVHALRTAMAPHGFNLGMNQGNVAGAGIAAHLHQHIVPRWGGDTNFMPIVAHTRVLPQLLGEARAELAAAWPSAL